MNSYSKIRISISIRHYGRRGTKWVDALSQITDTFTTKCSIDSPHTLIVLSPEPLARRPSPSSANDHTAPSCPRNVAAHQLYVIDRGQFALYRGTKVAELRTSDSDHLGLTSDDAAYMRA